MTRKLAHRLGFEGALSYTSQKNLLECSTQSSQSAYSPKIEGQPGIDCPFLLK